MNTVKHGRYPNFDLLRLLLAAEVALSHTLFRLNVAFPWVINPVPAFVGISGFLVLGSMERSGSYRSFAWRRVCRVGPAFLVSLVLCGILFGAHEIRLDLVTWASLGLVTEGHNNVLWSLSAEEVLYVLMALGFALGFYRRGPLIWVSGLLAAAIIPAVVPVDQPERIGWLPPAFICGSICYLYRDRLSKISKWFWALLLLVVAVGHPPAGFRTVLYWREIHSALGALAVVGFGAWGPDLRLSRMPDLSYGLYIYHFPLLVWCQQEGWNLLLSIPLTLVLAAASWYGIEKHALKLKDWRPQWVADRRERSVSVHGIAAPEESAGQPG